MRKARLIWSIGLLLMSVPALAGSFINTIGSNENVAINGFDTVAFFIEQKSVPGKAEHSFEWMGAKWLFASEDNLERFKAAPEKYAPQYGGHCALGVSMGYISNKPTSGLFEIVNDKLYLFPSGTRSHSGAYDEWRRVQRVSLREGDSKWPKLKAQLESR
jgi:YHS domain-containing protein